MKLEKLGWMLYQMGYLVEVEIGFGKEKEFPGMNPVYIRLGRRKLIWARSKAKTGLGQGSRLGCVDQVPVSISRPSSSCSTSSPLGTEGKEWSC